MRTKCRFIDGGREMQSNYVKLISAFNRIMREQALPMQAQLLYYKLLDVWMRNDCAEMFTLSNRCLMNESGISSETRLIKSRNMLIEAGLLSFQPGTRNHPSAYSLIKIYTDESDCRSVDKPAKCTDESGSANVDTPKKCAVKKGSESAYNSVTVNNKYNNINNNINTAAAANVRSRAKVGDDPAFGAVVRFYSENISRSFNGIEADMLKDWYDTCGKDWVLESIREAVLSNAKNMRFISTVLKSWQKNGFKNQNKPRQRAKSARFQPSEKSAGQNQGRALDELAAIIAGEA